MIKTIRQFLIKVVKSPDIRRKIGITALILFIYRLLAHIPASGVDRASLQAIFSGSPLLSLLDVFSGGTLANFSILALGFNPYITASIILNLLTTVVPALEELQKEGEFGQEKINQYTRFLTIPLAFFQAFAMYVLLKNQGVITELSVFPLISLILTMTAGSMLVVWLGELITEYGVSNGVSFLIFAGIVARLPVTFSQSMSLVQPEDLFRILIFLVISVVMVSVIVFMNEATRRIPINYARRTGRAAVSSSYLPLRLNQAGVIPIIFAVSLVLLPSFVSQYLSGSSNIKIAQLATGLANNLNPQSFLYNALYFSLVFGFTYFYTAVIFNPEKITDNLKKNGGFIPGIRPGEQTTKYLTKVLNRITLVGATFLGLIAILPSFFQNIIGVANLAVGGTGILIVVSVILEFTRELESQLVMRKYEGLLK